MLSPERCDAKKNMSLYLLLTQEALHGTQALTRLPVLYADNQQIADNAWIIKSDQSSEEISNALFPRGDETTIRSHMVVRITAYYGWYARSLWEWMSKGS